MPASVADGAFDVSVGAGIAGAFAEGAGCLGGVLLAGDAVQQVGILRCFIGVFFP